MPQFGPLCGPRRSRRSATPRWARAGASWRNRSVRRKPVPAMTPPRNRKPPASPAVPAPGPGLTLRHRLRALAGVELWHVEEPRQPGQKWPTIRYEVAVAGADVKRFERPQEAWRHFQQLTQAPDRDVRPE